MNKKQLISKVAERTGKNELVVGAVLDAALATIQETLNEGEPILISKFGKFEVKTMQCRCVRDFKTGQTIVKPSCNKIVFKASK